jgi:hypothetical protein
MTNVLEAATCARRLHILELQTRPNMVEVAALRKLKRGEPDLMVLWTLPTFWSWGHDLTLFIDAIMHLLFCGICKTMAMSIERWCSGRGKRRGFESFCHSLIPLVKHLGLDYCRVESYAGEMMGGWVSDSYLALCHCHAGSMALYMS